MAGRGVVLDVGVAGGRLAEQGAQRLVEQLVARGIPDAELDVDGLGHEPVAHRRVGIGRQAAAVRAVEVDAFDRGSEERTTGILNSTQCSSQLVVARLLGRGDVLGGRGGGVWLGGEVGAAGHHQVELGPGVAGDLNVIGRIVGGDEVVEAGRVVGRAGRAEAQDVALVVHQRERHLLAIEALDRDRGALALAEREGIRRAGLGRAALGGRRGGHRVRLVFHAVGADERAGARGGIDLIEGIVGR